MAGSGIEDGRSEIPRGRWPAGFVGLLLAVLAVEALLSRLVRFESMGAADWRTGRMSAEAKPATSAEILCLGDSLVKTGVVPAALEARLDRTAYNLAAFANPTPATFFLLRRTLAAGARPRAIVLDADEAKLGSEEYRTNVAAWAGLIGPSEALELAGDDRDLGFLGLFLVHYLLPSVRLRQDFRAAFCSLFDGPDSEGATDWPRVLDRQRRRNGGALLFPALNAESRSAVDAAKARGAGDAIDPATPATETNLLYLDRILALARSRDIRVFLIVPPSRPDVLAVRERLGLEARYLGLFRGLGDRYRNVVVIDGRRTVTDGGFFLDAIHMDYRGATVFSRALAEAMEPWLHGPPPADRWVDAIPLDGPTARLAIETMDESRWTVAWQRMATTDGSTR